MPPVDVAEEVVATTGVGNGLAFSLAAGSGAGFFV
jgi:hypothetical protein